MVLSYLCWVEMITFTIGLTIIVINHVFGTIGLKDKRYPFPLEFLC